MHQIRDLIPFTHVNIILFHNQEVELPLSRNDNRARHLLTVLHRKPGDTFDAGIIDGPRGKGTVCTIGNQTITLSFVWSDSPPPLAPIHLLVGLPRPQTAKDILRDATTLGVASLRFVRTMKGEASYANSSLWQLSQWKDHVIIGAAQAFCTRLPTVTLGDSLDAAIAELPPAAQAFTLDNYEAATGLSQSLIVREESVVLALGSERGWADEERQKFRSAGFIFAHLGARALRTETACTAAITIAKAKLGLL